MSELFKLVKSDYVHGLFTAVVGAVLGAILTALQNGGIVDWRIVLTAGAITGLSFLTTKLNTASNGKIGGKF